jgi:hypothetical protein
LNGPRRFRYAKLARNARILDELTAPDSKLPTELPLSFALNSWGVERRDLAVALPNSALYR